MSGIIGDNTGRGTGLIKAAGGGAWTFLQEVSASDDATITVGSSALLSSTYDVYKIFVTEMLGATDSVHCHMRVSVGGAVQTGSYHYVIARTYSGSSGWSFNVDESSGELYKFMGGDIGNATGEGHNGEITILSPAATGYTGVYAISMAKDASVSAQFVHGWGYYSGATTAVE